MLYNKMGSITDVEEGIVAHGCNCQGVMGAGVAKSIRETWPKAFEEYKELCGSVSKESLLGSTQIVKVGVRLYVANCFTQLRYGRKGVFASVVAINSCFGHIFEESLRQGKLGIHMPKIGCGLGGLTWHTQVLPLLREHINRNQDIKVRVYTL